VEVVFDRARADEELGGDLEVRPTLRHKPWDLRFLGRQVVTGSGGRCASVSACGGSSNKPFCDGTHMAIDFDGTLAN
jgi:CDGSH-type Zn-finger protein